MLPPGTGSGDVAFHFDGRAALVTGAAAGLGRVVALALRGQARTSC